MSRELDHVPTDHQFREEKGLSARNIDRMLAFHREYPYLEISPQTVAKMEHPPTPLEMDSTMPTIEQIAAELGEIEEKPRVPKLRTPQSWPTGPSSRAGRVVQCRGDAGPYRQRWWLVGR